MTLTIIPAANPDGVALVTGTRGRFTPDQVADETERRRFNADNVDINRNWDCDWQPTGQWGGNIVSGGSEPFSEAESYYLKEYFLAEQPRLVTFWHSKIPGVFLGQCDGVVIPDTRLFAEQYATASGYPLVEDGFTRVSRDRGRIRLSEQGGHPVIYCGTGDAQQPGNRSQSVRAAGNFKRETISVSSPTLLCT